MTTAAPVRVRERMFWSWDDALGVWLGHVVEEIRARADAPEWLQVVAQDWAVAAAFADFGIHWDDPDDERRESLSEVCRAAAVRARAGGDLTAQRLRDWQLLDGLSVASSFTGERVELDRVLEVARGFTALLDGSFPADPPGGRHWFLGTGEGPQPTDS